MNDLYTRWRKALDIGPFRFGIERSTIFHTDGRKYLTRNILYFGLGTLRLHKFWSGDDDRASHTHPWWFITFPLRSYTEDVYFRGAHQGIRLVKAFRPHFRPSDYEHVVQDYFNFEPFYTIVLTGMVRNTWGFYDKDGKFTVWWEYQK